ncbi:hypothetical protein CON42_18910 [Bacillus thuringiensis]|uniref:hypothetical protein n=2 Tax=Bacillus thuringiensis TaxID=1428 RepID=UPI000BEB59F9|nr:hypothetical protein [Bacillus thuringiensis]PEA13722.1 hypothetical protein CON42_18910 [Bacillus thuringiensis]PEF03926.1 hypothetical protein COM97_24110 [Bacillus thuringiensis]PFI32375.1 hypothetical protein COI53_09515 [Bacillus thuringiensis]PFP79302.1 hypothetical protein COK07_10355 [Bacillus thuringiensis]
MLRSIIIALLLFGGLYLPTSSNGNLSSSTLMLNSFICFLILGMLFLQNRKINKTVFFIVLGGNIVLWIATLITPFPDLKYGSYVSYLLFFLLCCLNLKDIEIPKSINSFFLVANIINIVMGLAIIFQVEAVHSFIKQNYGAFYDDLVPNMLFKFKPVISFASHSLAGFFLYIFFYLNLQTYKVKNKHIYLLISFIYIYLLFCLKSNAGFMFMLIAVAQLMVYYFLNKRIVAYSIVLIGFMCCWIYSEQVDAFLNMIELTMDQTFSSHSNGVLGRYSDNGNLAGNLDYINEHPFRPIGFGYSPEIFYGDSGIVEYLTRGSVLLVLSMYGALFLFLKNNLYSKKIAYSLFILIVLFEIGFTVLTYGRMLYLLPFVVLYLNSLEQEKEAVSNISKPKKKKIKIRWSA